MLVLGFYIVILTGIWTRESPTTYLVSLKLIPSSRFSPIILRLLTRAFRGLAVVFAEDIPDVASVNPVNSTCLHLCTTFSAAS